MSTPVRRTGIMGRPKLGRVKVTVTLTPTARDFLASLAARRQIGLGVLIEEILWRERERLEQEAKLVANGVRR